MFLPFRLPLFFSLLLLLLPPTDLDPAAAIPFQLIRTSISSDRQFMSAGLPQKKKIPAGFAGFRLLRGARRSLFRAL